MTDGKAYGDVSLRPCMRQLLIDEGVSMLGALALLVAGGLDGVPAHTVLLCLGLALVAKVCYRLVYLRQMEYTITGEQLVYEHGVFSRSRDYIELYRVVDFEPSSCIQGTAPCRSSGSSASGRTRRWWSASGSGSPTTERE